MTWLHALSCTIFPLTSLWDKAFFPRLPAGGQLGCTCPQSCALSPVSALKFSFAASKRSERGSRSKGEKRQAAGNSVLPDTWTCISATEQGAALPAEGCILDDNPALMGGLVHRGCTDCQRGRAKDVRDKRVIILLEGIDYIANKGF